jgi:hypothetical protein
LTRKRNSARSGRSGHASRHTIFIDFLAFSLLALNFSFRRHKAAGDGRQMRTGRTPETGKIKPFQKSPLRVLC